MEFSCDVPNSKQHTPRRFAIPFCAYHMYHSMCDIVTYPTANSTRLDMPFTPIYVSCFTYGILL